MSFREKWRFAIKCMKYSYNLKTTLICAGVMFALGLLYEVTDISNGIGIYFMVLVAMYPAQLLYSICGSQLVQSSPYKKTLMTSLPTVITLCGSLPIYLLVIIIQGVRAIMNPETAGQSVYAILMAGMTLLFLDIYVGIVYKYFWVSMVIMCVSLSFFYVNFGFIGSSSLITQISRCSPMPVAIAVGLCLVLLGSLLQYGVSLLVYKKPISKRAIYGMMRQQT